jgi:nucleotide-binding universal stress UspA family protein
VRSGDQGFSEVPEPITPMCGRALDRRLWVQSVFRTHVNDPTLTLRSDDPYPRVYAPYERAGMRRCGHPRPTPPRCDAVRRLAVGVDVYPEGRDAAALGEAISQDMGATTLPVAVNQHSMVVAPQGANWTSLRWQASAEPVQTRDAFAPNARLKVLTDQSMPRALHRVVQQDHRDQLVLGSSRHARARPCTDRKAHSAALVPLRVRAGDRAARSARTRRPPDLGDRRIAIVEERKQALRHRAGAVMEATSAALEFRAVSGRPADGLLALSADLDLLAIGSRRWGPVARVPLGSTGEAVMHDAACSVVAVPWQSFTAAAKPPVATGMKQTDG